MVSGNGFTWREPVQQASLCLASSTDRDQADAFWCFDEATAGVAVCKHAGEVRAECQEAWSWAFSSAAAVRRLPAPVSTFSQLLLDTKLWGTEAWSWPWQYRGDQRLLFPLAYSNLAFTLKFNSLSFSIIFKEQGGLNIPLKIIEHYAVFKTTNTLKIINQSALTNCNHANEIRILF